ncbi:hypothetical protein BpHYR1_000284 [Brachionus plicatilis]|uniref:Uncharacterized protein n=1 Tax=Brachionus plicatilis TaxID=10195 RepID=A0A3M7TBU7_BRAPC|nr:hypothetical protein BpHYR1_000284 [Brachionus plicatilis]
MYTNFKKIHKKYHKLINNLHEFLFSMKQKFFKFGWTEQASIEKQSLLNTISMCPLIIVKSGVKSSSGHEFTKKYFILK